MRIQAKDQNDPKTEPPQTDNTIYSASFFEKYLPQNALEMIQRLPGFKFDPGSNARGFGGNAGNVLINNARPTSKSGGLRAALVRIPASQVSSIEIIRGGVSSSETAGQSIVANVILKKNTSSGSWAFKERWTQNGSLQPNLEAAIITMLGNWNASFDIDIGAKSGYRSADIENQDADQLPISSANEELYELNQFLFINGEFSQQIGDGKLTLNSRLGEAQYAQDTRRDIFVGRLTENTSPDQFWELDINTKYNVAELSVDWNQNHGDWKWRMIGLGLVEKRQFENQFDFQTLTPFTSSVSSFKNSSKNTEYIARLTFSNTTGTLFKPEYGVELARNKLISQSTQFQDGIEQTLNGGDVVVKELRAELFTTFVYAAAEKLTLEGSLTGEISKIEVEGDANQAQSLRFVKPRISATYKFDKDQQWVIEIERRVGQLNFNDFAASSQVSDDRTTSGNPDLAPDTTIELALTYDWSFSARGSLKIKFFHRWINDILEQVLLPSGGQGIGNAGNARFYGIETDLNIPIDFILSNAQIELSHHYYDSSLYDPIINATRIINGYSPRWLRVLLRQDITQYKLAWGLEYFGEFIDTNFFVDEKITFSGNKRLQFFIETSQFLGVKIQFQISDLNTAHFDRKRFLYEFDRGNTFTGTELARRIRGPEIKLTVSKNF